MTMQARLTTRRSSPTWRRLLMPALCVVSVLMLAAAAPAQDSDDDGVLPNQTAGDKPAGGSGANINSSASTTVSVTAAMDDDVLDPEQASLALSSVVGDTTLATEVDAADAVFVADTQGLTIQQDADEVSIQGLGDLWMHENLSGQFRAPTEMLFGMFVLVVDDGTSSLDDLLDGNTQPLYVAGMGNLSSFSLNVFYSAVMHHAAELDGFSVTLIHVSLDQELQRHASAVRLSSSGGPVEVLTR
jgi:hypothetical protein